MWPSDAFGHIRMGCVGELSSSTLSSDFAMRQYRPPMKDQAGQARPSVGLEPAYGTLCARREGGATQPLVDTARRGHHHPKEIPASREN